MHFPENITSILKQFFILQLLRILSKKLYSIEAEMHCIFLKLVDIFVSKKLQFNNEKYSQGEWKKLGWHDLFDVSNLIQGSFSS